MKAAIVRFPGSNCDLDMYYALRDLGFTPEIVSEKTTDFSDYEAIFLPGGFAYGDYLRTGAVARFAPAMTGVKDAADEGKLVIGICNGFQMLTEAGMLPGQLMLNEVPSFICDEVTLDIVNPTSRFTQAYTQEAITIPIAHGEGRYFADAETIAKLHENNQVIFKYRDNVNGSIDQIAGIQNEAGNVFGMMPHPERAVDTLLGNVDGQDFFKGLLRPVLTGVTG